MAAIQIGFGGEGFGGWWNTPFRDRLLRLQEDLAILDETAVVDFLELRPTPENAEIARSLHMPILQFTDLYCVEDGGLDRVRDNIALAVSCGIQRINMQVQGDQNTPQIATLVEFYQRAYELADAADILLVTETHIDRFTYDPRRLLAVHQALLDAGERGLIMHADFSHYAHQIENQQASTWSAQESGDLVLGPKKESDIISSTLIPEIPCYSGHLRMAVPNQLGRGRGSIQYPVVAPEDNGEAVFLEHYDEYWNGQRTESWWLWYQALAAKHQALPDDAPPLTLATEFICVEDEYRMDPYSNYQQNLHMMVLARKRLLKGERFLLNGAGNKRVDAEPQ